MVKCEALSPRTSLTDRRPPLPTAKCVHPSNAKNLKP
jgi:hypothetical protein